MRVLASRYADAFSDISPVLFVFLRSGSEYEQCTDSFDRLQATLYKMGEHIITENTQVQTVSYSLPNKHYIPVDMRYIGIDNLTPYVTTFLSLSFALVISFSFLNLPRSSPFLLPLNIALSESTAYTGKPRALTESRCLSPVYGAFFHWCGAVGNPPSTGPWLPLHWRA